MKHLEKIRDEMALEAEKIIIDGYGCPEVSLKECASYIAKKSFDSGAQAVMVEAEKLFTALEYQVVNSDCKTCEHNDGLARKAIKQWQKFVGGGE